MLFSIHHTTEYRFTRPVFFEPHQLRFQPRSDSAQRLVRFDLEIEPAPAGTTQALDTNGNVVSMAWFSDLHDRMVLRANTEVETLRENPFDYLLTPVNRRLPIGYQPWEMAALGPACRRVAVPAKADPVLDMACEIRDAAGSELVPYLTRLCTTLYDRFKLIHRETGSPWPPAITMEQRQGSCRDMAALFNDACRAVGLAARFVSGYQEGDPDQDERHLHAWSEVYLPGAGWRGYDPTHGLAIADRHVSVAAAADPQFASPVTATYRGTNVEAELSTHITIGTSGVTQSQTQTVAC
jgi:transglutaminase-like putative cysteine protease